MDSSERSHLLNALFGKKSTALAEMTLVDDYESIWQEQMESIATILKPIPKT